MKRRNCKRIIFCTSSSSSLDVGGGCVIIVVVTVVAVVVIHEVVVEGGSRSGPVKLSSQPLLVKTFIKVTYEIELSSYLTIIRQQCRDEIK